MKKQTKIIILVILLLLIAAAAGGFAVWTIVGGIKKEYRTPNKFTDYVINEEYDKAYDMFRDDHKKATTKEAFEEELKEYGLNKKCEANPNKINIHSENGSTKKEIGGVIECKDDKKFDYTVTLDGGNKVIGFIVNRTQ